MRALRLLLISMLVSQVAFADSGDAAPQGRGFLTGLGVVLLAVSGAGAGLGIAGAVEANANTQMVRGYPTPPAAADVANLRAVQAKVAASTGLAAAGFIMSGVALIGGIVFLAVDGPRASAKVSLVPTWGGGAVTVHVSF